VTVKADGGKPPVPEATSCVGIDRRRLLYSSATDVELVVNRRRVDELMPRHSPRALARHAGDNQLRCRHTRRHRQIDAAGSHCSSSVCGDLLGIG